jgi:hypothetical protein
MEKGQTQMKQQKQNAASCPFCQKTNLRLDSIPDKDGRSHFVYCVDCKAAGPAGRDEIEAVNLWNCASSNRKLGDFLIKARS